MGTRVPTLSAYLIWCVFEFQKNSYKLKYVVAKNIKQNKYSQLEEQEDENILH